MAMPKTLAAKRREALDERSRPMARSFAPGSQIDSRHERQKRIGAQVEGDLRGQRETSSFSRGLRMKSDRVPASEFEVMRSPFAPLNHNTSCWIPAPRPRNSFHSTSMRRKGEAASTLPASAGSSRLARTAGANRVRGDPRSFPSGGRDRSRSRTKRRATPSRQTEHVAHHDAES